MRFWDSSAVVPLLRQEKRSRRAFELLERDEQMCVWWSTPVECWSGLARLRRENRISMEDALAAERVLELLRTSWFEIYPSDEVRRQTRRLLRVHPLRAADALQLAAAVVWGGRVDDREFVVADARLRDAARLEGFAVADLEAV